MLPWPSPLRRPFWLRWAAFALVAQGLLSSPAFSACSWQPGFEPLDLGYVGALATWDDGHGSALYAAGLFETAAGVLVNSLARWDGEVWSALPGLPENGVDAVILELTVWDDGTGPALYVGGRFSSIGGIAAKGIAKWNGQTWSALAAPGGSGLNGNVNAMVAWDDGHGSALYVGGFFTLAGGVTANRLAKWDGQIWSALAGPAGNGVNYEVRALAAGTLAGSPALFAGGSFTTAGGITVNRIAKWNGSAWSALVGASGTVGVNESVETLLFWDRGNGPELYAGGYFSLAGNVSVPHLAKWNGQTWSPIAGAAGGGPDSGVETLAVWDSGQGPALYAGGNFQKVDGKTAYFLGKWNGSVWSALADAGGNGVDNSFVDALVVWDDGHGSALYIGGNFSKAGAVNLKGIAKWNDAAWSALETTPVNGLSGGVAALLVWDDGSHPALYAGGAFKLAGRLDLGSIAKWDGSRWWPLSGPAGNGVSGSGQSVAALAAWDDGNGPALYAAGSFLSAGGVQAYRVAKWNGHGWAALGPAGNNFNNEVDALVVWDDGSGPALYAGGNFTAVGGISANRIAKWDGATWSALRGSTGEGVGTAASNWVNTIAVWDDGSGPALFVGGLFASAGGIPAANLAKWNGSEWSALSSGAGNGVNEEVYTLHPWNDGDGAALYAGGAFTSAAGVSVNAITRWNGHTFSALAAPLQGTLLTAGAIQEWDDGTGSALFVAGQFLFSQTVRDYINKWDGSAWSSLVGPRGVRTFAAWDDGQGSALYAGGATGNVGGIVSNGIGKYFCGENARQPLPRLASISHLEKGWNTATTIRMVWSGAKDAAGTAPPAGYSVLFDDQPGTTVDLTIDVPHDFDPHKISSGVLTEGKWYFHFASCDQAAGCGATVHRGPYGIDFTAPAVPTGITSSSHQVGVPSKNQVVKTSWQAAADQLSGVAGYAWTFSPAATWDCDGSIDSSGDIALSPTLGAGSWYFHLCAIDRAGNRSGVASAGPFVIDLTPPTLSAFDTVADTGDSDLHSFETTAAPITQILARWNEALDPASATDLAHWMLVSAGADGQIDSLPCLPDPADVDARPNAASLLVDQKTVRLDVGSGFALPAGDYLLVACAGISDRAGNGAGNKLLDFKLEAKNPVANPNLDSSIAPWLAGGTRPQDLRWSPLDAEGKPTSGSLEVATTAGAGEKTSAELCIELPPGEPRIVFSGEFEASAGPLVTLELIGSATSGCTSAGKSSGTRVVAVGPTSGWQPFAIATTGNWVSVIARLEVSGGGSMTHEVRFDRFELSREEAPLFSDGFESGDTSAWPATMH